MIKADKYYKENLKKIKKYGYWDKNPRPRYADNIPAHSKFITAVFEKYDIEKEEFPITTLRNTAIKTGIKEILWIYQKQSNCLIDARNMGINWWNEWEVSDNKIGQRYGATIKRYDLINNLLESLKNDPYSRRHIINMYQYSDLNETKGLFPCAYETLWSVHEKENKIFLNLTLIQRSNDYIMSGYINKIQYVALQMMIASHLGYNVGEFSHLVQNLHIYNRHFNALNEILERKPINNQPKIKLKSNKSFFDFVDDDFEIIGLDEIKKIKINLDLAI